MSWWWMFLIVPCSATIGYLMAAISRLSAYSAGFEAGRAVERASGLMREAS